MKKFLLVVAVILSSFLLNGCTMFHQGQAKTPAASYEQEGRDYMAVNADFVERGFTNIRFEVIDDLIFGWLTKDGEVEKVTVNGNPEYVSGKWFPADVEVVIYYHTFPEQTDNETEAATDDTAVEDSSVAESEDTKKTEDTEKIVDEEKNEENNMDSSNSTSNDMPILSGSSLSGAVKIAAAYDVVEVYDEDFGHKTRCKSLSDSEGGLMIDIIYSADTEELLSAVIVTSKLASTDAQRDFVKEMAKVTCPADDAADVSAWISDNIGDDATTVISDVTYEVGLGPVDNIIYSVGNAEWEAWESQYW